MDLNTKPPKHPIFSKTLQGLLIMSLPTVLGWFGVDIAPETAIEWLDEALEVVGFLYAAYGRFVAKRSLAVKS